MISVIDYINLVLNKKKWTRADFQKKLNILEEQLGEIKTNKQTITNILNGDERHFVGFRTAIKWEKVLELKQGTLLNMIKEPITRSSQKELEEYKKKVGSI